MNKEEILSMEAGRELDALVGARVMGLDLVEGRLSQLPKHYHPDYDRTIFQDVPLYSSDISAAWEVIEKIGQNKFNVEVMRRSDGMYFATIKKVGGIDLPKHFEVQVKAETAPLAICKAALLAVMDS